MYAACETWRTRDTRGPKIRLLARVTNDLHPEDTIESVSLFLLADGRQCIRGRPLSGQNVFQHVTQIFQAL